MTLTHDQHAGQATVPGPVVAAQPQSWSRTLRAAALAQAALLVALSLFNGLGPAGWAAAAGYTGAVCVLLAGAVRRAGRARERERGRGAGWTEEQRRGEERAPSSALSNSWKPAPSAAERERTNGIAFGPAAKVTL